MVADCFQFRIRLTNRPVLDVPVVAHRTRTADTCAASDTGVALLLSSSDEHHARMMSLDEFISGLDTHLQQQSRERLAALYADSIAIADLLLNVLRRQRGADRYRQQNVDRSSGTSTLGPETPPRDSTHHP